MTALTVGNFNLKFKSLSNYLLFKLQSHRNEPLMTASPVYDGNSDNDLSLDLEPEPIPSPPSTKPVLNRIELDQDLKKLCRYDGTPCYQKNHSHLGKYRHPKDNEGSEKTCSCPLVRYFWMILRYFGMKIYYDF